MDLSILDQIGGVRTVIAVAVVLALIVILRKLFSGSKSAAYAVPGKCASCHWTGSVSKYRGVCPRCGSKVIV